LTAQLHRVGAPWEEVLARLGIQMGADTARQLYRAFATLPPELSCEMDAAGITLATRLEILRLDRGCRGAARELWEAVKAKGHPELLAGAVSVRGRCPDLDAGQAVEAARVRREDANLDRARVNRRQASTAEDLGGALADPAVVATALEVMRGLVAQLR